MNASNNLMINIADPVKVAEAPGQGSAVRSGSESAEAFNTVYHNESRGQGSGKDNNPINNKDLKSTQAKGKTTDVNSKNDEDGSDDRPQALDEGLTRNEELADTVPGKAETAEEKSRSIDDLLLDESAIAMTDRPMPGDDNTVLKGEMLPPSGKNLPLFARDAMKETLENAKLASHENDALLSESEGGHERVVSRLGIQPNAIQGLTRSESGELQHSENFSAFFNAKSGKIDGDNPFNFFSDKSTGESLLETITSTSSNGVKDLAQPSIPTSSLTTTSATTVGFDTSLTALQASTSADSIESTLNIRGNSTDWSQAIGDKVRWMQNAKVSTAELHLNPAELGSIEIKIVTEDQQARVQFVTSSAAAQEMIEESMSKLKELLGDHGIALDQSDVSQRDDRNNEFAQQAADSTLADTDADQASVQEASLSSIASPTSRIGQIDQYV